MTLRHLPCLDTTRSRDLRHLETHLAVVTERSEVTIKGLRVSKMLDPTIEVTMLTSLPLQVICHNENATISNQMRGHTHATPILNDGHL